MNCRGPHTFGVDIHLTKVSHHFLGGSKRQYEKKFITSGNFHVQLGNTEKREKTQLVNPADLNKVIEPQYETI